MSFISPYRARNMIVLFSPTMGKIQVEVLHLITTTLSCVSLVRLGSSPVLHILKLFDRRFSEQLREDEDAKPWSLEVENNYHRICRSGDQSALFQRWTCCAQQNPYWPLYGDDDTDYNDSDNTKEGKLEAYLQFRCQRMYTAEKRAYDMMRDIQGKHVPTLISDVYLRFQSLVCATTYSSDDSLGCPGFILQYIPGYPLTDLTEHAPVHYWQPICEKAIDIILDIGNRGIINRDVKTRSFILQGSVAHSMPQIFMVDFGECIFREQVKSDWEFRRCQADEDEEGAIGEVMHRKLGNKFLFKSSERRNRLKYDFKRQELSGNAP